MIARQEIKITDSIAALLWLTARKWRRERLSACSITTQDLGVARHADAGYELAQETARERGIAIPMTEK